MKFPALYGGYKVRATVGNDRWIIQVKEGVRGFDIPAHVEFVGGQVVVTADGQKLTVEQIVSEMFGGTYTPPTAKTEAEKFTEELADLFRRYNANISIYEGGVAFNIGPNQETAQVLASDWDKRRGICTSWYTAAQWGIR